MRPPHLLPCPFCGSRDVEATPRDFHARVTCNAIGCNAEGPFSCTAVGPEWEEIVVESAAVKWNDAVCRYPWWVRK